jgi:hypothetical protein
VTNDEFGKAIKALEKRAKGMSVQERNQATGELIERYVQARGEAPPANLLDKLADFILYDDLSDKAKRRREDRPAIYTERLLMKSHERAVGKAFDREETKD